MPLKLKKLNCPAKIGGFHEIVRYNRDKVHEVADRILSICGEPMCFERILQEVFKGYGLAMNFEQYVLVGSTVRSYLSWLKDTGKLSAEFQNSMLLWRRNGWYVQGDAKRLTT